MARIKIECFEEDKEFITEVLSSYCQGEGDCRFSDFECDENCHKCIEKDVEFVIKEGE